MIRAHRKDIIICLLLASATVLVYWQLADHQFITVDDNIYVTDNPYIQSGLTRQNIKWAFTTFRAEFWHPLTWLSYMLDTQIYGVNPNGYLFSNLLLHIINSLLLFLLLKKMTATHWQSAFVACLFALHPLHVESVAWIAERKDVLSALFWMLTMGCYAQYVERPGYGRYLPVCLFFALGLMAKPMLVTLPFVLLLLDYWPLGRFQTTDPPSAAISRVFFLVREKIPLFVLAASSGIITFIAQKSGGGISSSETYSFTDRIANSILAYTAYIGKMIWPHKLSVFYPFPDHFPAWKIGGALFLLIFISIAALKLHRRHPFFIIGWLWYLGTLVPVIGLVKIGDFAMADRYTYIPLIGLFIIVAWGVPEILAKSRFRKLILTASAAVALFGLTAACRAQVQYWTNSFTLFEHALNVTDNNFFAHFVLGHVQSAQGKFDLAIKHLHEAVRINPGKATLNSDLGRVLACRGRFEDAIPYFSKALEIKPDKADTHYYLGNALVSRGDLQTAIYHFSEASRLARAFINNDSRCDEKMQVLIHDDPRNFNKDQDLLDAAIHQYQTALLTQPDCLPILRNLALAYAGKEQYAKALSLFKINQTDARLERAFIEGFQSWKLLKYN